MDVASKIPVRGGGTPWGEPDDWFPGVRGARGDILSKAAERDLPESGR